MEQWYTLYTKPNAEYQVVTALQKRGIQTYLPEIESVKERRGRDRKPFFPCYLFIKVDLRVVGLSRVRWTPGLRRIVAFDDRPVPLPEEVISLVQRKLGEINAAGGRPVHNFQPGDTVRITDGPLQSMLAIFEGPTTPAERVQVLLTFLGHARRASVPVTDLEKAPAEAEVSKPKRPRRTRGQGRQIKNGQNS
ncbi:MAG: transcription termination/antitermination NusG family protein [Anaerolineae bacterium]